MLWAKHGFAFAIAQYGSSELARQMYRAIRVTVTRAGPPAELLKLDSREPSTQCSEQNPKVVSCAHGTCIGH